MFGIFGSRTKSISMREAQAELEKDKSIVLLDVRGDDEYRDGHIPGSTNVPLHLLPALLAQKVPDKTARIFVYCLSGGRSEQAAAFMKQSGYADVTNIGGISAWRGTVVR